MKVRYDPRTDTLTIVFAESAIAESNEKKPSVVLDYDQKGNLVSVEILDASQHVAAPNKIEYKTGK